MYKLKRDLSISGKICNSQNNELPDMKKSISRPVSQKCRVCLQHGNIPVFKENSLLDFPLSHYLKLICNIHITVNDTHPQHLCKNCFDVLDSAIKLRKTAIKSQLKLKLISLKQLHVKSSVADTDTFIHKPDKLMSLQQMQIRNAVTEKDQIEHNYDVLFCSPLQKPVIDFEKVEASKTSPVHSLSQTEISHENKVAKHTNNHDGPTLTLDQVKKLRTKDLSYDNYYKKVSAIPTEQTYQCRICKKNYKKGSIADHILLHLPDSVSLYVCEVCGKTFKKFCTFYKHGFVHQHALPFECKICPYKGSSKNLLQIHTKRVHIKEYKYQCTKCPRKFLDTNNLRYHLRRHDEPKFSCHICHKMFYENCLMKKHIESQHMNVVPHKCDICGNLYKNRKNLLSHQIKIHKRKQVYNNRATYLKFNQQKSDRFS